MLYTDSINANFYRDNVIYGTVQQLVAPVVFMVQPELHFRQYDGVTNAVPGITGANTRDDVIFAVVAGIHYAFRNWIAATLDYQFSTVQTDYRYTVTGDTMPLDPSYVRNELMLGVRAAM